MTLHDPDLHAALPPVGDRDDPAGTAVLMIQRHLFRSLAHPDSQGWMAGLQTALAHLGALQGPALFAAVAAQVQALRRARGGMFTYTDPLCPCCSAALTPDEDQLARCLGAIRQGRMDQAGRHALILCEGEPPTWFLDATEMVAGLLPPVMAQRLN